MLRSALPCGVCRKASGHRLTNESVLEFPPSIAIPRWSPSRHKLLCRRNQRKLEILLLDRQFKWDFRRRQNRVPSVRFYPLEPRSVLLFMLDLPKCPQPDAVHCLTRYICGISHLQDTKPLYIRHRTVSGRIQTLIPEWLPLALFPVSIVLPIMLRRDIWSRRSGCCFGVEFHERGSRLAVSIKSFPSRKDGAP